MPSSRQTASTSSSTSRVHSEYSVCTEARGVDGVAAAQRGGAGLGEADGAHLAGLHQTGHRADALLDGCLWVDAVELVEVDDLDAQAAEARVAGGTDVRGRAVDPARGWCRAGGHDRRF